MTTRFIVLGGVRCGGTLVAEALAQHPDIVMYGELFLTDPADRSGERTPSGHCLGQQEDGATYLRDFVFRDDHGRMAVGFKHLYAFAREGPHQTVWDALASDCEMHVIHVVRDNLLEVLVSQKVAERTNQWRVSLGGVPQSIPPFLLSLDECDHFFALRHRRRAAADELFRSHPMLVLDYEQDIRRDFGGSMELAQHFLRVSRTRLTQQLVKQARKSLRDQLANYDELKAAFTGTDYSSFFL